MDFLHYGTQDMLDSCLDSGWMSTTLFASNAPSLPPCNSIYTLYQDQTKERVNFYKRNGNMHLSSCHRREGERERESTCMATKFMHFLFLKYKKQIFYLQTPKFNGGEPKTHKQIKFWKKLQCMQRGESQKPHRLFTPSPIFFFLIVFYFLLYWRTLFICWQLTG